MPALEGAVALAQVDAVPMRIEQHLDFDVARSLRQALHDQAVFAEGGSGLATGRRQAVLESIRGVDDVHALAAAAGEALEVRQPDIEAVGHAVEVRLYAEDAEDGFLPATGRIEALRWPAGDGIRVDAGIVTGTEIGPRFDPMLAKIVAHGRDRAEAFERLTQALDETVVLGLVTNLRFLRWLVRQEVVLAGNARTDTLDRIWPPDDRASNATVPDEAWHSAAAALAKGDSGDGSADPWTGGWRLNAGATIRLETDGVAGSVAVTVVVAEPASPFESIVVVDEIAHVDVGGRSVTFRLASPPDVDRAARAAASHIGHGGSSEVVAPMPGSVLTVHVAVGTTVASGDPVVTLEAMKMEHIVAAPFDGRVTELAVRPADQVTRGQTLASIES
jgi:acetyl-CoA/propionyl-CoA carboxylase biotin carboxyl carrier protein